MVNHQMRLVVGVVSRVTDRIHLSNQVVSYIPVKTEGLNGPLLGK